MATNFFTGYFGNRYFSLGFGYMPAHVHTYFIHYRPGTIQACQLISGKHICRKNFGIAIHAQAVKTKEKRIKIAEKR
ncbi:MAG TPA: hypothetical protein VIZ28_01030 [Chitinophagaceae bacterium]